MARLGKRARQRIEEENDNGLDGYYTDDDEFEGKTGEKYWQRRQRKHESDSESEVEEVEEPREVWTVNPYTGEDVRLGELVDMPNASIVPANLPIPQNQKSERMVIPVEDLLSWETGAHGLMEPAGPSSRQVCITLAEDIRPGTSKWKVHDTHGGYGRGYKHYK